MRNFCLGDFGTKMSSSANPSTRYLYRKLSDGTGEIYAYSYAVGRSMPKTTQIKSVKIPRETMAKYSSSVIPQAILASLVKKNVSFFSFLSPVSSVASNAGQFFINAGNMVVDAVTPTLNKVQNYHIKPVSAPKPVVLPSVSKPVPSSTTAVVPSTQLPLIPESTAKSNMNTMTIAGIAAVALGVGFILMNKEA